MAQEVLNPARCEECPVWQSGLGGITHVVVRPSSEVALTTKLTTQYVLHMEPRALTLSTLPEAVTAEALFVHKKLSALRPQLQHIVSKCIKNPEKHVTVLFGELEKNEVNAEREKALEQERELEPEQDLQVRGSLPCFEGGDTLTGLWV